MNYTIQLDFKDGQNYIDYSNLLTATDFTKHSVVSIEGHEQSTLNITFKADENLFRKFIESGDEVLAKVFKNEIPYFIGYIRNTNSYNINEALQPFSFQILDNSYLLEKKPKLNELFLNNKIIDNTNISNSLIHNILLSAGISDYEISVNKSDILSSFILSDTETYSSILNSLMGEYGLSYSFKADGFFTITELFPETITPFYTLTNSELIQPLSITKLERTNYGIKVLWTGTSTKTNQLVYRQFKNPDDKELILSGLYFPENANNVDIFQKFSNITDDSRKLIYAFNHSLDIVADDNIIVSNEEYFSDKAKIYFTNTAPSNSGFKYLYSFDIRADIVVEEEEQSILIDGNNISEYPSKYISSETAAENLAKRLFSKQKYQNYKISFDSKNDYNIGQNIRIVDSSTGINLIVFLSSKDETENNPIKSYTAYSVGDLSFITNPIKKSISINSNDYNTQSELNNINSNITDLNSDISNINTSINSISNRVTNTENDITTANTNISNINNDISSINSDFTAIQTRVTNAENEAIAMSAEITTQANTIDSNKSAIETALATAQNELETSITSLNSDITAQASTILENKSNIETALNTAKNELNSAITDANSAIELVSSDIVEINDTTTAQGLLITQNTNDIALKANQTEVDTLSGTVSSNSTLISQNASNILLKANQTDLDSTNGNVSSNASAISINATAITSKVNQADFNTLSGTVTNQETAITQNANSISSIASRVSNVEGLSSSNSTLISQNADEIELKANQIELDNLAGTVSSNSTSINQNASNIELKANQTDLDSTNGNVSSNTSAISVNATAITSKVNQTDFNSLSSTVSSQGTSITQNATDISSVASRVSSVEGITSSQSTLISQNADEIALKANQTDLDTATGNISNNTSAIEINTTAITSKVNQTDFNALNETVSINETNITQNATDISSVASRVSTAENKISSNSTLISQNADEIALRATKTEVNSLSNTVSTQGTAITQNATDIALKATKTEVNTLSNTVSTQGTLISQNADEIALKATKTEVNSLGQTVSTQGTAITQNATDINSIATALTVTDGNVSSNSTAITQNANDINSLASRVTTTENSITANESNITQNADAITSAVTRITNSEGAITSNVSSIQQNAADISTKVTYSDSSGNLSSEATLSVQADISGSKIILDADEVLLSGSVKADKIDVNDLFATDITIGNRIKSESYDDTSKAGFELTNEGTLTARKAILKDIRLEVGDENDKLLWVQQGQNGDSETVSPDTNSRFATSDFFNDYKASVTYDSTSGQNSGRGILTTASRPPDAEYLRIRVYFQDTVTLKFHLETGVNHQYILDSSEIFDIDHTIVSGGLTDGYYTQTFTPADDHILIVQNYKYVDLYDDVISIVGDNSAIFTTSNSGDFMTITIKKVIQLNKYSAKTATINNVSVPKTYVGINNFYNMLPANDVVYKINTTSSTLYYKGALATVSYVKKTSSNISFFFSNNSSITYLCDGTTQGTTEYVDQIGWGDIYGTIQIMAEEKGVVCDILLPFKPTTGSTTSVIGSSASPFSKIYGIEVHGKVYAS